MMYGIISLVCTIILGVVTVTTGVFLSRLFIYIMANIKTLDLIIPFADIFYISTKAGLAGGTVGGAGIWLIHVFNLYRRK